jgi:hypothetical protein
VVGDWLGSGKTTIGVVDPNGGWCLRTSNSGGAPDIAPFLYRLGDWTPLAGAWSSTTQAALAAGPAAVPDAVLVRDLLAPGSRDSQALDSVFASATW